MWDTETTTGLARIVEEVSNQADMIGFLNAFELYTVASVIVLPLIWMVRMPEANGWGWMIDSNIGMCEFQHFVSEIGRPEIDIVAAFSASP